MAEPTEAPMFRVGDVLAGKYRLGRRLGKGGMAEVYRAENEFIGRAVAIKLLLPECAEDSGTVTRFIREARAANKVRHPNVVDVLDVGQTDEGRPFMVLELLEGRDLAAWLHDYGGRLSLETALGLLIPVADAVAYAHSVGVIHRDLKPENVFLADLGGAVVPKVLDFGISKMTTGGENHRVTVTGTMMGTPAYMSPEQIEGVASIDARTDVWAFGVMLYEVLTGVLPFDAETRISLFVKISTQDPEPMRRRAPELSPDIERVVARCLRRDPAERYANVGELLADLCRVRDSFGSRPDTMPALKSEDLWRATDRDAAPGPLSGLRASAVRPTLWARGRSILIAIGLLGFVALGSVMLALTINAHRGSVARARVAAVGAPVAQNPLPIAAPLTVATESTHGASRGAPAVVAVVVPSAAPVVVPVPDPASPEPRIAHPLVGASDHTSRRGPLRPHSRGSVDRVAPVPAAPVAPGVATPANSSPPQGAGGTSTPRPWTQPGTTIPYE